MQSCRTIHDEASPVFWGCNKFLLQAEPEEGVWPTLHYSYFDDWDWGTLTPWQWNYRVPVESPESRNKIRKLAWEFPAVGFANGSLLMCGREQTRAKLDSRLLSNLQNVEELHVLFNAEISRAPSYPHLFMAKDPFYQGSANKHWSDLLERNKDAVASMTALLLLCEATLRRFTALTLPSICKIVASGVKELSTEGRYFYDIPLLAFAQDSVLAQVLERIVAGIGKLFEYGGVQEVSGICESCGSPWTEEHWTEDEYLNVCPGWWDAELVELKQWGPRHSEMDTVMHVVRSSISNPLRSH